MEEALRLRLKFEDPSVLSESQRLDGLKRSWILLEPRLCTISDVVSHLLRTFHLSASCPNGILLSMDGFVLPYFETTAILRDEDLVCVKRIRSKLMKVIEERGVKKAVVEQNYVEKLPFVPDVPLLTNEEFEKGNGGCQGETEEDEDKLQNDSVHEGSIPIGDVIKKRKASKPLKSSKRKRCCESADNSTQKVIEECGVKKAVAEQNYVEKLQLVSLLADEEFEKGTEGCHSGTEEDEDKLQHGFFHEDGISNGDVSIKKRKASKQLKNSKRKRQCENAGNSTQKEYVGNSLQNGHCQKLSICNLDKEHKPEDADKDVSDAKCTTNAVLSGLIKNQEDAVTPSCLPDGIEKVSVTRSTRRKKAKRMWIRSQRLAENEQIIQKHTQAEDLNADVACKDQNLDAKDPPTILDEVVEPGNDIVPVVVRPGHIRFAASGKEKEVEQYEEEEVQGSFNWQGITNKKKGQKWGMDKQSSSKRTENKSSYGKEQGFKENIDTSHQETRFVCTWDNHTSPLENHSGSKLNDHTCSRSCTTQQEQPANASMDYEKLVPLTDNLVQGDIIAYRLLELSSSFCPEMTSFRVGKVSWFDPESNRVMLVLVPEYPFEFKKAVDDTSAELPDTSNYNEDGSLEIDYPSLVDVRIVKRSSDLHPGTSLHYVASGTPPSGLNSASSGSHWRNETQVRSKASSQELTTSNNWIGSNTSPAPASENGNKDVWEEVSAALSTKKAELLKEDNWNKKTKPPRGGPRSYRARRSSAFGPTVAWLRAQNGA